MGFNTIKYYLHEKESHSEATFLGQDIKYFSKESDDDDCLNSTPIQTKSLQNGTELPYN